MTDINENWTLTLHALLVKYESEEQRQKELQAAKKKVSSQKQRSSQFDDVSDDDQLLSKSTSKPKPARVRPLVASEEEHTHEVRLVDFKFLLSSHHSQRP